MNKPLTISELSNIDTKENLAKQQRKEDEQAINLCIGEINDVLKKYWHKIDNSPDPQFIIPGKFVFGLDAFYKAKELFEKNGIGLYYYSPHGMLTIKRVEKPKQND